MVWSPFSVVFSSWVENRKRYGECWGQFGLSIMLDSWSATGPSQDAEITKFYTEAKVLPT
jgi:hypothetical protein